MNKVNWTQVGVFAVVALLVFLIGVSLLGGLTGYGMMRGGRYGMMGPGMMGGWGFGPFAWLFMLMGLLFPVGVLVLLVLGIVWLFRRVSEPSGPTSQAPAGPTCSNCGRPVQADWRLCPYCGQALTSVGEREGMTTRPRWGLTKIAAILLWRHSKSTRSQTADGAGAGHKLNSAADRPATHPVENAACRL